MQQQLLATAAAAAASQVAASLPEPEPTSLPQEVGDVAVPALPVPKLLDPDLPYDPDAPEDEKHDNLLAARRLKDRRRYATMSPTQRAAYNAHRRDLYHKQGETARQRRRERERQRYHSLEGDDRKNRNARRAKLERDRYQKLSKEDLAERNRKRRERAKSKKTNAKRAEAAQESAGTQTLPDMAAAAEVSEKVIDDSMEDEHVEL